MLEEEKASPEQIEILIVDRDTVCSSIVEDYAPNVQSWAAKNGKLRNIADTLKPEASLKCPNRKKIVAVEFASFGNPSGYCGAFALGNCNAAATKKIAEQQCLGKESCKVAVDRALFAGNGTDFCPGLVKKLAIQVKCSF